MNFDKARELPRDSVLYGLLRDAIDKYAKEHQIVNKYDYFAAILCYDSRTRGNQLLMSLMDVSLRKLSLDELKILLSTFGTDSSAFANRLLEGTGLVCVPVDAPEISNIEQFSALHLIRSGELAKSLLSSLEDKSLDKKEKVEIYGQIDSLIGFLSSLRETIEEYGHE